MRKKYIIEIIAFIFFAGVITFSILAISLIVSPPDNSTSKTLPLNILRKNITPINNATLVLDFGDTTSKKFAIDFSSKTTAFDLLSEGTLKNGISLTTKVSDMGTFVEAIGNKQGGQDGKYWMYYINGQLPSVGADKYELKTGDRVEWKFEKPSF